MSAEKPIAHGTQRGYAAHLRRWDESCEPCREAHNAYERDRRAKPRPPRQLVPCGSPSAYRRHLRRGEPACDRCRTAHVADVSRYPRAKRGAA